MQTKTLSVSIAAYNVEKTLGSAVQSLLVNEEKLRDLEIIIVNDGSSDGTGEQAHRLKEQYPETIVVIDKPNGGYGSTINASLQAAVGKYYKLLDGDDWYEKENLEAFLDFLKATDADLIVSPYYEVRNGEELIDRHREVPAEACLIQDLDLSERLFMMHELAIRTECLRSSDEQIAEKCFYTDAEFVYCCISAAKSITRFDRPVYKYRLGEEGQSVSLNGIRKHYRDLTVVSDRIMKRYSQQVPKLTGNKKALLDQMVCNITYQTFRAFLLLEDDKHGKKELKKLDRNISEKYQAAYQAGNASRLVNVLRKVRFVGFGLISRHATKTYQ